MLVFPPEDGIKVVSRFRDMFEAGAPDDLCGELVFMTAPSEEFVLKGSVSINFCMLL